MSVDDVRRRIRDRIEALGTDIANVEREAGLSRTFLQEFLAGKKSSMRGKSMAMIAEVLQTTELWLVKGIGDPDIGVDAQNEPITAGNLFGSYTDRVSSVGPIRTVTARLNSLNLATGECFYQSGSSAQARGLIVDPSLLVRDNPYLHAFSTRKNLSCQMKIAVLDDGKRVAFILDAS